MVEDTHHWLRLRNASKTWLVVKDGKANEVFGNIEVRISASAQQLECSFSRKPTSNIYLSIEEIKRLSSIGTTQPHSAFSAFTHGFAS